VIEPARLHTDPESELERSLLDAGRSYKASGSARQRALAATGLVGVTVSSTTTASALSKAGLAKWLAAAALVTGAAVPTVRYLERHSSVPLSAAASARATTPAGPRTPALLDARSAPAPTPPVAVDPAAAAEAVEAEAAQAAPELPIRTRTLRTEPRTAAPAPLSAELGALDAARSALGRGQANEALAALDAYARNFPHGKLGLEAEVLRIDALAKSGQAAAASKRAQAFVERYPNSVLAARLRAYVRQ
jgi:hypothetical protein